MRIIITEEQNKKLFIPRNIDKRQIESEKIRQRYISEIKEIIDEKGDINYGELDGDSPTYEDHFKPGLIAFFTNYKKNTVEVTYFNEFSGKEVKSMEIPYEELNLLQLSQIREVLDTYDIN